MNTEASRTRDRASEMNVVCRALDGDADAFASIFNLHKHRVFAICLRMTSDTAEADDLTQEVFIQAFRKLSTFRGECALSTWLYRLAVNATLMHFRKYPRRELPLDETGEPDGTGLAKREQGRHDDRLRGSLDRIALVRALEALPRGYRTIFELHEISGYGHREIARLLHCSVGNSKSQLHKAKEKIRECLFPGPRHTPGVESETDVQEAGKAEFTRKAGSPRFRRVSIFEIRDRIRPSIPKDSEPSLALESPAERLAETAV